MSDTEAEMNGAKPAAVEAAEQEQESAADEETAAVETVDGVADEETGDAPAEEVAAAEEKDIDEDAAVEPEGVADEETEDAPAEEAAATEEADVELDGVADEETGDVPTKTVLVPMLEPEPEPEPEARSTVDEEMGGTVAESSEADVTVVVNKDEMPVVELLDERDQETTPSKTIAEGYRTLYLPAYTMDGQSKTGLRVPCDRGYAEVDANGWLTTEGVELYPLIGTTMADLGAIGGVGMRQYYFILKMLTLLFLFLGMVSAPAMFLYGQGGMYNHPAAARFSEVLGSKWSKGNVIASEDELSSGRVGELWLGSITNAVAALTTIFFTLWMGKKMN
eukprot:COSAG02_NODE_14754_length_1239_cov_1.644737_1_plen_335_part_10